LVEIIIDENFKKKFQKIKNNQTKEKIIKQIEKIKDNPEIGKPMQYERKGTRELYISPYRLSYELEEGKIYILDIYHKDQQ
jgi:mRNA-degrading endonuclease RelE of RelBE toxin-antitoxin system